MSVYKCLTHIEDESLKIARDKKPTDKTITLWFGLDGLRLNENGAIEWVKRDLDGEKLIFASNLPVSEFINSAYNSLMVSSNPLDCRWQIQINGLKTSNAIIYQLQQKTGYNSASCVAPYYMLPIAENSMYYNYRIGG